MDNLDEVYVIVSGGIHVRSIESILTDRDDAINTVKRLNAGGADTEYVVEEYPVNTEVGLRGASFSRSYASWDGYYAALEAERQIEAKMNDNIEAHYAVETEICEIFMGERKQLNELEKIAHTEAKDNSTVNGVVDKDQMRSERAAVTELFASRRAQLNMRQNVAMNDAVAALENKPEDEGEIQ